MPSQFVFLQLPPVLHQRPFVDLFQQFDELILLVVLFETVAGVDWVVVVPDLRGIKHQQFFSIVTVQFLDLLGEGHLIDDLVVYHLLVTR